MMEARSDWTDYENIHSQLLEKGRKAPQNPDLRVVSASVPSCPHPAHSYIPPKTGELRALSLEAKISDAFESFPGPG